MIPPFVLKTKFPVLNRLLIYALCVCVPKSLCILLRETGDMYGETCGWISLSYPHLPSPCRQPQQKKEGCRIFLVDHQCKECFVW